MVYWGDWELDKNKIEEFVERYRLLGEGILDIYERRQSLTDEAQEALRVVLQERGLSFKELERCVSWDSRDQDNSAHGSIKLFRGFLSKGVSVLYIIVFALPAINLIRQSDFNVGAFWLSLIAIVAGYLGYRFGKGLARSICGNEVISLADKKHRLWMAIIGGLVIYFVLFVVSNYLGVAIKAM